jgi:chromosome segregation ATPase
MNATNNNRLPAVQSRWRKRLGSVARYIEDVESRLSKANATISTLEHSIQELRRHIEFQDQALRGDRHECC